jgi:hypothetical protein
LRHLPNWQVGEAHSISAELRVVSHLDPDKVTVPQIHGIQEDRGNAPPQARASSARLAVLCKAAARGQTPNAKRPTQNTKTGQDTICLSAVQIPQRYANRNPPSYESSIEPLPS